MAEVRRVGKAPIEGDFGDRFVAHLGIHKIPSAAFQSLRAKIVSHGASGSEKNAVEMAD